MSKIIQKLLTTAVPAIVEVLDTNYIMKQLTGNVMCLIKRAKQRGQN
jgi:hypothetical protein